MSNLKDAVGLCVPYGRAASQYETEFEPASSTLWGYFNPRGTACFSLGLLTRDGRCPPGSRPGGIGMKTGP